MRDAVKLYRDADLAWRSAMTDQRMSAAYARKAADILEAALEARTNAAEALLNLARESY